MTRPISSYVAGTFPIVSQQVTGVFLIKEGIQKVNLSNKLLADYEQTLGKSREPVSKDVRLDIDSAKATQSEGWRTILDGFLTLLPIIGSIYTVAIWVFAKKEVSSHQEVTGFEPKDVKLPYKLIKAIQERKQEIIKEKTQLLADQRQNLSNPSNEKMEEVATKIGNDLHHLEMEWNQLNSKLQSHEDHFTTLETDLEYTTEKLEDLENQLEIAELNLLDIEIIKQRQNDIIKEKRQLLREKRKDFYINGIINESNDIKIQNLNLEWDQLDSKLDAHAAQREKLDRELSRTLKKLEDLTEEKEQSEASSMESELERVNAQLEEINMQEALERRSDVIKEKKQLLEDIRKNQQQRAAVTSGLQADQLEDEAKTLLHKIVSLNSERDQIDSKLKDHITHLNSTTPNHNSAVEISDSDL